MHSAKGRILPIRADFFMHAILQQIYAPEKPNYFKPAPVFQIS